MYVLIMRMDLKVYGKELTTYSRKKKERKEKVSCLINFCFNSSFEGGANKEDSDKEGRRNRTGKNDRDSGMSWLEGKGTVNMMAHFHGTKKLRQDEKLFLKFTYLFRERESGGAEREG